MPISAIIKVSGTDPEKEASVQLIENKTPVELIDLIFDDVLEQCDSHPEYVAGYTGLKNKWINYFESETDRKKINVKKIIEEFCPKNSVYVYSANGGGGKASTAKKITDVEIGANAKLIAIDIGSSYDFHYFLIPKVKFINGIADISIYEH
jgi:hypothetical protein